MITPQETEPVRAGASRLRCPGDLQFAHFRARLPEIEPECDCSADRCCRTLQKVLRFTGWLLVVEKRRKACSAAAYFVNIRRTFGALPFRGDLRRIVSAQLSKMRLESYRRNREIQALHRPDREPAMKRSTNRLYRKANRHAGDEAGAHQRAQK